MKRIDPRVETAELILRFETKITFLLASATSKNKKGSLLARNFLFDRRTIGRQTFPIAGPTHCRLQLVNGDFDLESFASSET